MKIYFTKMYQNFETPFINSNNDVISNIEINELIVSYQKLFNLKEYKIIYDKDVSFKNFGLGFNQRRKEIYISRKVFPSVGYEIDYILSRMWYAKESINKTSHVKVYSFLMNYLLIINVTLILIIFILQTVVLGMAIANEHGTTINNSFIKFLWDYPLLFILNLLLSINFIMILFILNKLKYNLEIEYTKDTLLKFGELFPNYKFDLSSARTFSSDNGFAYNLSFKIGINNLNQIKWIGPFSNY